MLGLFGIEAVPRKAREKNKQTNKLKKTPNKQKSSKT